MLRFMTRLSWALLLAASFTSGCGDDDVAPAGDASGVDAATAADAGSADAARLDAGAGDASASDAGPPTDAGPVCFTPPTECPVAEPVPGAPCAGTFSCTYGTSMYGCSGDLFEDYSCVGCPPAVSERCDPAFMGTLAGGRVELGPAGPGPFRPYAPGERVFPQFGGQGAAMFFYRVRVSGDAAPPECVSVSSGNILDSIAGEPITTPARLRCGESTRIYSVYGASPCEMRDYPLHFDVTITGVGTASVDLVVEGGMCPRGGFDGLGDGGAVDGGA